MNNWGLAPVIHPERLLLVPLADRHPEVLRCLSGRAPPGTRWPPFTPGGWPSGRNVPGLGYWMMTAAGLSYVRTYLPDWEDPLPGSEQGEVEYELTLADWLEAR